MRITLRITVRISHNNALSTPYVYFFRFVKEVLLCLNCYLCMDYTWNSEFNLALRDWLELRLISIKCEEKNGLFIQTLGRLRMTAILKTHILIHLNCLFSLSNHFSEMLFQFISYLN